MDTVLPQIAAALSTVHNGSSASQLRQEAQQFLESIKTREDSALIGWQLNSEPINGTPPNGFIRHFGLTLIESSVQYQFQYFDESKRLAIRNWVVQLAFGISDEDPHYIREKIAYLWVSIAKRVWGMDTRVEVNSSDVAPSDGWVDMDARLVELWNNPNDRYKEMALSIIRNLFEDIYLLDDPVATKRMNILSSQAIEITASKSDLQELYAAKSPELDQLRGDQTSDDGWLNRLTKAIPNISNEKLLLRVIETIKSTLEWVPTVSILSSKVLDYLVQIVTHSMVQIRVVISDCLHILFNSRSYSNRDAFESIVGSVFQVNGIKWLSDVYSAIYLKTGAVQDAADDLEYVFAKKFVELIVFLGDFIENDKTPDLPENSDYAGYFRLALEITKHPSLMVSGLVLQFWCSVLRITKLAELPAVKELYEPLMITASERCIRYDHLPESNLSRQYMEIDYDSQPTPTQFYLGYQRYMEDILRLMVCRIPVQGSQYIHSCMTEFFQTESGWKTMNTVLSNHSDPAYIYGCAQFNMVECAIRGITRWQVLTPEDERTQETVEIMAFMAQWAEKLLALRVVDLTIYKRTIENLVQFAPLLKDNDNLLFRILERVLEACTYEIPESDPTFEQQKDSLSELRTSSGTELNRLAYMVPEALSKIYNDLERVISNLIVSKNIKEHESVSFKSFLLVASQRSHMPYKEEKFVAIVDPVLARWTDESTMKGLADLEWFMERVGVVEVDRYFKTRGITASTNLLETPMDEAGLALKANLKEKWQAIFPIRPSRIFIQYTIERLDHKSPEYLYLLSMWKPRIQPILPHILQLIAQIMAYHNPANWAQLPPEVQTFVKTSCTERFWQVGISMQTRDEFENANQAASRTLRDFADSIGHIVRYTREYAFLTLGSISQLEDTLYEINGMGVLLAEALTKTTEGVTSHAWRHMISLVVRNVIKNCPPAHVPRFMEEFLPPFLRVMNDVLVSMWSKQAAQGFQLEEGETPNDDDLSDEMMEEYLLRQLTAIVDRLLIDLVGQSNTKATKEYNERGEPNQKMVVRKVCRNNPAILMEILRLCQNLMVFKDSRCCFNTCLIIRHLLAGPPIEIMDEIAPVFVTEIIPPCLTILSDKFFSESHLEVGTILTLMYAQLPTSNPSVLQQLAMVLPNVTPAMISDFDRSMSESNSLRQQRGVFMDFLTQCRVLESDEQSRARNKKQIELKVSARNVQEEHYDSEALINMFNH